MIWERHKAQQETGDRPVSAIWSDMTAAEDIDKQETVEIVTIIWSC